MQKFIVFFSLALCISSINAQAQTNQDSAITQLPFQLFLPQNEADPKWDEATNNKALLVFLHGSGERGSDNKAQLKHGAEFFKRMAQDQNTVVLVPQCPKDLSWHNGYSEIAKTGRKYHYPKNVKTNRVLDILEKLIDSVVIAQKIDKAKIKIGGLSMGGMGTLELLRRRPEYYQRAFVICGGGHKALARQMGQTPIWFFHGEEDQVVLPKYAQKLYRKLRRKGIETKWTLYPGVDHNSWDLAFEEQELISWLSR
jgi:predicted peptidase